MKKIIAAICLFIFFAPVSSADTLLYNEEFDTQVRFTPDIVPGGNQGQRDNDSPLVDGSPRHGYRITTDFGGAGGLDAADISFFSDTNNPGDSVLIRQGVGGGAGGGRNFLAEFPTIDTLPSDGSETAFIRIVIDTGDVGITSNSLNLKFFFGFQNVEVQPGFINTTDQPRDGWAWQTNPGNDSWTLRRFTANAGTLHVSESAGGRAINNIRVVQIHYAITPTGSIQQLEVGYDTGDGIGMDTLLIQATPSDTTYISTRCVGFGLGFRNGSEVVQPNIYIHQFQAKILSPSAAVSTPISKKKVYKTMSTIGAFVAGRPY